MKSPAVLSALLAAVLYCVTLWGTYVYDDYMIVQEDPRVASPSRWYQFWTQNYNGQVENLYRPITSMTYAIQIWLHGPRAWAFHLVNLVLHAVMSALVAVFAMRVTELLAVSARGKPAAEPRDSVGYSERVGLLAGLLFAAHPVHVEAVANIVGRAEVLCGIGTVGGLVLFLHRPLSGRRVLAIVGCFLLTLLSKEIGILFPLLLFILLLCRRFVKPEAMVAESHESAGVLPYAEPTLRPADADERRATTWLVVSMCWILASYIILREQVIHLKFWWDRSFLDWAVNPLVRMSTSERLFMPITIFGHYIALLVAPIHLSPDYSANAIGLHFNPRDPYFLIGLIALIAWFAVAILAFVRRHGALLFCLLAFGLTYGVISNLLTLIGTIFGERLIYLPSAFFLIVLSMFLAKLPRKALVPIAVCAVLLASVRTFTYAKMWNNKLELFETTLAHHPDSIRLYLLLANEYRDHGRLADARAVLNRATERLPNYWEVWLQAGITALKDGDFDEAERCVLRAMKLQPGPITSYWMTQIAERRATTRPATQNSSK